MSLDISRVRFEPLHGVGRLLYRQQGLLRERRSFVALSTSDFAGDVTVFAISDTERRRGREKDKNSRACRRGNRAYLGTAGLGFPSRPEVSFAHVVEVPEVVDHDAVTINFGVGRLGHLRLPVAGIGGANRKLPDCHERNCAGNRELRPPARSHERERCDRTQPKDSR